MLNVLAMPANVARGFNRSSLAWFQEIELKKEARRLAPNLWQKGMDLLLSIHKEKQDELETIWARPDAEQYAKEIQTANPAAIEQTMEELMPQVKRHITDDLFSAEKRAQAKRELAEQAKYKA